MPEVIYNATTSITQCLAAQATGQKVTVTNLGSNSVTVKAVLPDDAATPSSMTSSNNSLAVTVATLNASATLRIPTGFKLFAQATGGASDIKIVYEPYEHPYPWATYQFEALKGFRPVGARNRFCTNIALLSTAQSVGTGASNYTAKTAFAGEFRVLFSGMNNNTTDRAPEYPNAGPFTVKALLAHDGTQREVFFKGDRTARVERGAIVISDPVLFPTDVAAGDKVVAYTYTDGFTTTQIPYTAEVNPALSEYPQSGNSADRANVVGTSGSNYSGGTVTTGYNYCGILLARSNAPLMMVWGDSVAQSVASNKAMPRVGGFERAGYFSRALWAMNEAGSPWTGLNISAASEMAVTTAKRDCAFGSQRLELIRTMKPKRVLLALGANDVLNGQTAEATIEALALIEAMLYRVGVEEVWHVTIAPTNVSSTDNFLVTANMSVANSGQNTVRNTVNAWKRAQKYCFDAALAVEHYSAGAPQGIWKAAADVKTAMVAHSTTTTTRIYTTTETDWTYAEWNTYGAVATSGAQNGICKIITATNNTTGPNRSLIDTGTWSGALASGDTFKLVGLYGVDGVHPGDYGQNAIATALMAVDNFWRI